MQEVFLANDQILGRQVALKRAKNGSAERRFKRSAVLSARVNHPNVAKTLDYVEEIGQPYLAEEYVSGCNLAELIDEYFDFVDPNLVARLLHNLVRGISASHGQGVLHRDIKPSNIMVVGGILLGPAKVTDFGIAKMTQEEFVEAAEGVGTTLTTSKTVVGALPYMAPEAIETPRTVTLSADIWSLGAVAYELLFGKKPFGTGLIAVKNITAGIPPPFVPLDRGRQFAPLLAELSDIIKSCLQHDSSKRPTAESLVGKCSELCYAIEPRYTGTVTEIHYHAWGFIRQDDGASVFFHLSSVYGAHPKVGDRVLFSKYMGGGSQRAFPLVRLKK
jgi:serine/threonine-protein kinase